MDGKNLSIFETDSMEKEKIKIEVGRSEFLIIIRDWVGEYRWMI